MNDLVKTQIEFDSFTPSLKDKLCKYYKWIEAEIPKDRFEDVKEFDVQAIKFCTMKLAMFGQCEDRFADIFIANLDMIKDLVDNQPSIKVEVSLEWVSNDETITDTIIETFHGYDNVKKQDFLTNQKWKTYYKSHKIID